MTGYNSSALPTNANLAESSMLTANLHPMLQSSGRSNLISLRDNGGVAGNFFSLSEPATVPFLSGQPSATLPDPLHQNQLSLAGPPPAALLDAPMPLLSLPNEATLSESLPTAEALALEGLFEHGEVSVAGTVMANVQQEQQLQDALAAVQPIGTGSNPSLQIHHEER